MDRIKGTDSLDVTQDKLRNELKAINTELVIVSSKFESFSEHYNITMDKINAKKHYISAQDELIQMIKDQIKLNETLLVECNNAAESATLDQHKKEIEKYLRSIEDSSIGYETQLKQLKAQFKQVEREMNSVKPRLRHLRNQQLNVMSALRASGKSDEEIFQMNREDMESFDCDANCIEESLWLLKSCSRDQAVNLLCNRENGTFLIRQSTSSPYVLSIVVDGTVHHCKILFENNLCGFSKGYLSYPDLKTLVAHYKLNSLEVHNPLLKTRLTNPVNLNSENQLNTHNVIQVRHIQDEHQIN